MTDVNSAGVAVPVDWRALLLVRGERWVESRTGLLAAVEYRSLWSLGDRRLAVEITVHPRSAAAGALDRARVRLFSGSRWRTVVTLPEELLEVSVAHADLGHFRWQEGRLLWEALVVLGADPASLPPETRLAWLLYAMEPGDAPADPADEAPAPALRRASPQTAPLDLRGRAPAPSNGGHAAARPSQRDDPVGPVSLRTVRQARPADRAAGGTVASSAGGAGEAPDGTHGRVATSRSRSLAAVPVAEDAPQRQPPPADGAAARSTRPERSRRPQPDPRPFLEAARTAPRVRPVAAWTDADRLPWTETAEPARPAHRTVEARTGHADPTGTGLPVSPIGGALGQARDRVAEVLGELELRREAARSLGWTPDGGRPGPLWEPESGDAVDPDDPDPDDWAGGGHGDLDV